MKIFIISLKDSPRRSKIKRILKENGVPFEFFDAVDARKSVPIEYQWRVNRRKSFWRYLRTLSNGEWGCALSHALLYEKIVCEKISDVIILEDDVILTPGFFRLVKENLLSNSKIEMAFLYHYICYAEKKKYFLNGLPYQKVAFMPYSTASYYLKLPVVKELQKKTQIISCVADFPLAVNEQFYTIAFSPRLVKHPFRDEKQGEIIVKKTFNIWYKIAWISGILYFINKDCYGSFWAFVKRFYFRFFFKNLSPSVNTSEKQKPPL